MLTWPSVWGRMRPLFNFTASKFVVIKDWRLGVALRALQMCILCYLITNIVLGASYLQREIPTGIIVTKPVVGDVGSSFKTQFEFLKNGSLPYCTNPKDYDFQWSKEAYTNFKCAVSDLSTLTKKAENEFFLTTSYVRKNIATTTKGADGKCPIGSKDIKENSELIFENNNTCLFTSRDAFFPVVPEDLVLNLLHGYRTSAATRKNGDLPWTNVKSANPSVPDVVFEEGKAIHLTLGRWLSLANVDLDRRVDGVNGGQLLGDVGSPYEKQYPMPRVSGVRLMLTFNYYQRKLAPKPYKKATGKHSNNVICVLDVKPHYTWTSREPETTYMMNSALDPIHMHPEQYAGVPSGGVVAARMSVIRTGVEITFHTKGSMGSFSTSALIAALVAGSVMLGVAQTLVTYVALYALGLSSQLYQEFLRESVDWRKEYARYASQALVAGFAFMSYDRDHSGKLDRREIFKVLNTVLGHRLSQSTVAALSDFVMRQGESDAGVDKGRFTGLSQVESTISIEEWIDIFTQEKVQLSSLQRLIDHEYSDPADLELLTHLATEESSRLRDVSYKTLNGMDVPLLEGNGSAFLESDETVIDPEYAQYTKNKRAFFADFFMCNDPKAASSVSLKPEFEGECEEKEKGKETATATATATETETEVTKDQQGGIIP